MSKKKTQFLFFSSSFCFLWEHSVSGVNIVCCYYSRFRLIGHPDNWPLHYSYVFKKKIFFGGVIVSRASSFKSASRRRCHLDNYRDAALVTEVGYRPLLHSVTLYWHRANQFWDNNTQFTTRQAYTHPSSLHARRCLTSVFCGNRCFNIAGPLPQLCVKMFE